MPKGTCSIHVDGINRKGWEKITGCSNGLKGGIIFSVIMDVGKALIQELFEVVGIVYELIYI
jgi:hypothetical protein